MITLKTDALVIGRGLAGIRAAYELSAAGHRMLVIGFGSGASPFVHGINIPLDPNDSVEIFYKDTLKSGYNQSNPSLAAKLCRDSLIIKDEIESLGLSFNKSKGGYELLRPLGSSLPRVASIGNHTGAAVMSKLIKKTKNADNASFMDNIRALRFKMADGRVCGVSAYDTKINRPVDISARVVVLAAGGFVDIYPFNTNPGAGGDAVAMLYQSGAMLTDLEFVQFEPTVALWPDRVRGKGMITTLFHEGAVLRNAEGKRFTDEKAEKDELARCIYREVKAGKGTARGGVYFDATRVNHDTLRSQYPLYVKRYCDAGIDITRQPFEVAPAAHTSLGGALIDNDCMTNVEGLIVCGEAAGGIHGANRIGGSAGLETLVFGRQAGISACRYLKDSHELTTKPLNITPGEEDGNVRNRLRKILSESAGVIREGECLNSAKNELKEMLENTEDDNYGNIRLKNDLTVAYLLVSSCALRGESIGSHYREDSVTPTESYKLVLYKRDGSLQTEKRRV